MVLPQHLAGNNKKLRTGGLSFNELLFRCSLILNLLLMLYLWHLAKRSSRSSQLNLQVSSGSIQQTKRVEMVWHGGHPAEDRSGSCWCGAADQYCMCTPNIAIDLVIVSGEQREYVWLVRRKDTNQLATMGGFVDTSETVEHAVARELKEEMGIELTDPPALFGVYSDPRRDNRRRNVSAVFAVYVGPNVLPRAGDDAKEVQRIMLDDIEQHDFFADHRTILLDYRRFVRGEQPVASSRGDFAPNIQRSTCVPNLS